MKIKKIFIFIFILFTCFVLFSCHAGQLKFTSETPAGFWNGLWHGLIAGISFIVSLFNENVRIYSLYNNGGWYDFGFILGIMIIFGGGHKGSKSFKSKKKCNDKEWDEIGGKVEKKIMKKLADWAESEESDEDWKEIGKKVETKLKKIIKDWAEK